MAVAGATFLPDRHDGLEHLRDRRRVADRSPHQMTTLTESIDTTTSGGKLTVSGRDINQER